MIILNEENTRLFGEQVNDHIEKLNLMMTLSTGEPFEESSFRKTCFANRLLEGSTKMLGLEAWSLTLGHFGQLLDRVSDTCSCWDENLSQIVSEILEVEEQAVAEIITGELEEVDRDDSFGGIQQEILVHMEETYTGASTSDPQFEEISQVSIENGIEPVVDYEISRPTPDVQVITTRSGLEKIKTVERLVQALERVNDRYFEYLDGGEEGRNTIRDLELALGESEFFIGLLGNILRQLGDTEKTFRSKVSSRTVLDGVEDFIEMNGRLNGWKIDHDFSTDNFSLESGPASDLARIIENCIYDICRMYGGKDGFDLSIGVEIDNEGSFLVSRVKDNGQDFLCDSQIDRDDAVAYYKGLRAVRNLLTKWGCLLWVEPENGKSGRFSFTFPRTSVMTDYFLLDVSGMKLAVPCRCVDRFYSVKETCVEKAPEGMRIRTGTGYIPVCGMDQLAPSEIETVEDNESICVLGVAEKRLGILCGNQQHKAEGILEQVTEGDWASLTRECLHIGEQEYPVIDPRLVLERYSSIQGLNEPLDEAGFFCDEEADGSAVGDSISRV